MHTTRTWAAASLVALSMGCSEDVGAATQFSCETMAEAEGLVFCDDFNDGEAPFWGPEGGSWTVVEGRYQGLGPAEPDRSTCGASRMTASLRDGHALDDLAMHVELASMRRLDKTIVLRETDASNRIELNFRGDPLNDLIVQELSGCDFVFHTTEGEVPVLHGDAPIDVDVELLGDRVRVAVDGEPVLDRAFPFTNRSGRVGVAVIDNARTTFDSVWVRRLDGALR